jgi:uncharacterized protein HemX
MKKLQSGALALALLAVLTVGGGTVFAAQNQKENKLGTLTTTATKATAEEMAQYEKMVKDGTVCTATTEATATTPATKATAEEMAQYEKMVKDGTLATPSTAATLTEASTK